MNANLEQRLRSAEEIARKAESEGEQNRLETARRFCGEDKLLLLEVLGKLGERPTEDLRDPSARSRDPMINQKIGGYRIHWQLGAGGNGDVYLATRLNKPHQQVAMKFLTLKAHESDEFRRRFLRERQITAFLNHAYIVKLFDADRTKDGRPYYVMEHVGGKHFNEYADFHKLTVNARLNLFLKVCEAIQYLHQHLIVHRDLKPSNVMVDDAGNPKVLDFGIAKLLHPEVMDGDLITITDIGPMTAEYASPEQWQGGPVTSASDVYSLGVMLFQLLTGALPLPRQGMHLAEYRQLVCAGNLPRMSSRVAAGHAAQCGESGTASLAEALSGDLDAIVAKALRTDVSERYPSVEALAEDLRRHLQFLPVRARQGTYVYKMKRFVRRNRAWVSAGAGILLALSLGLGIALVQKREAEAQRKEAVVQRNEAVREGERVKQLVERREEMLKMLQQQASDRSLQDEQFRASVAKLAEEGKRTAHDEERRFGVGRGESSERDPVLYVLRASNYELLGKLLGLSGDKNGARQAYQSCVANLNIAQRAGDISAPTAEAMTRCRAAAE
jgi:serine/threonine-protein kinase